jgi:hypothetical protein
MSERSHPINDTLEIATYDLEGNILSIHREGINIQANTSNPLKEAFNYSKNQVVIARLLQTNISSKELLTSLPKSCTFTQPNIQYNWEEDTLILRTDIAAYQTYLHNVKGHFSDNFFTLLPHTEKRITFSGQTSERNKLLIWSLYDLQDNEK